MTKGIMLVVSFSLFGLCGCEEETDSVVHVLITGSEEAWARVSEISIEGKRIQLPPARIGPDSFQKGMSLCTTDRSVFLQEDTLDAEVVGNDDVTMHSPIERLACHVEPDPGYSETISVELRADGSIDADYGSKPTIYDTCSRGSTWICEQDEL